jgi:two-component system sensor histidine kinase PilS (NtrC family)
MPRAAHRILDEAQGSRERVKGMMLFRFVVIFFFLVAMLVPMHRDVFLNSQPQIYALLVGLCVLNCFYYLVFGHVRNIRAFAALQLGVDLVAETFIIYLSGAQNSNFIFLYFTSILAASIFLSARSSVIFASLATILLSSVSVFDFLARCNNWALFFRPAPGPGLKSPDIFVLFYLLVVHALAFYLVALLSGGLARRVTNISRLTREIVSNSDDGLIVLDPARRIVFCNQRAVDLLGHEDVVTVLNKPVEEVLRRETDSELRALIAGDIFTATQIDYIRRKDERLSLEISVRPIGGRRSKDHTRAVFLKDLTQRKRVERMEKLAEQLQSLQEMAAAIAHEVRNPLASIKGSVQELGRLALPAEEDRRLLNIVCRESDRLDKIISDFLQFAGLRPPKMRRCNVSALLDDVAELLRARAPEKPFQLVRDYPQGLACVADAEQLMQVFLNIGLNAFDAISPRGRITFSAESLSAAENNGTAERRRHRGGDAIRVRISDNGPGIPAEIMDKIFTPFFTTKEKGVGMGLAIVNRILQQHGIELTVNTSTQRGTAFILTINVGDSNQLDNPPPHAAKSAAPDNAAAEPSQTVAIGQGLID